MKNSKICPILHNNAGGLSVKFCTFWAILNIFFFQLKTKHYTNLKFYFLFTFNNAAGLIEVIIYSSPDDKKKNRGFCFLEYESHKAASLAKRRLGTGRIKVGLNSDLS